MKILYYSVSTGLLTYIEGNKRYVEEAYSGAQGYINNPLATALPSKGPIPFGLWRIGAPVEHKRLGPVALPLEPVTYAGKRSAFLIHGDNSLMNRTASKGCIIAARAVREWVRDNFDHLIVSP